VNSLSNRTALSFIEDLMRSLIAEALAWSPLDTTKIECKTVEEGIQGMNQGWSGTFAQLEEFRN
jgi:hypothetical protein